MLSRQNQQDVIEISSGDEEENVFTNLENKRLPDSETKTIRNNKMLTEVVSDRCQQTLSSQYKIRYVLCEKGNFVQLLHNGSYHWVAVSNINCTKIK